MIAVSEFPEQHTLVANGQRFIHRTAGETWGKAAVSKAEALSSVHGPVLMAERLQLVGPNCLINTSITSAFDWGHCEITTDTLKGVTAKKVWESM